MIYQNCSSGTWEFYGVEFKPGDIKYVPGCINAPNFVQLQSMPETVSDVQSIEPKTDDKSITEDEPKVEGRRKSKKLIKEEITDGSDSD